MWKIMTLEIWWVNVASCFIMLLNEQLDLEFDNSSSNEFMCCNVNGKIYGCSFIYDKDLER